jgi:phosphate transport system ATP-binding protein
VESLTPPPIRRILVDAEPTIVPAPPAGVAIPGDGRIATAELETRSRRRFRRSPGPKTERMRTEQLSVAYGGRKAVSSVSLPVRRGEVLALIGPSGCGKTTLLRSLNRLVELTPTATRSGRILLDDEDIDAIELTRLRRRVSMVFQQPNPFPMSVFDNVAYALREQGSGRPRRDQLEPAVIDALARAGLLEEVRADLTHPALRLSGGQQQRLCIARSLAARPEVLLLDEPCSALDPISTGTIEELIMSLRDEVAIVIVTHNLQQAERIADHVAFMYLGELVEYGPAEKVFTAPTHDRTREYVTGVFG